MLPHAQGGCKSRVGAPKTCVCPRDLRTRMQLRFGPQNAGSFCTQPGFFWTFHLSTWLFMCCNRWSVHMCVFITAAIIFCYYDYNIWLLTFPYWLAKASPHSINRSPYSLVRHTKSNSAFLSSLSQSSSVLFLFLVIERGTILVRRLPRSSAASRILKSLYPGRRAPLDLLHRWGGVIVLRKVCDTHDSTHLKRLETQGY